MTRRIVAAVVTLALLTVSAPDQVLARRQKYKVYGLGASSCGVWTADRDANGKVEPFDLSWVLGFVSGAGWSSTGDIAMVDSAAIEGWINNYCAANPLDNISVAAEHLVTTLEARAAKPRP